MCVCLFRDDDDDLDDGFMITLGEMKSIFDPTVDKAIALIHSQLRDVTRSKKGKCRGLVLVGGFAESEYLRVRIEREFGSKFEVIKKPALAGSCVIKGAVLFGLNPRAIASRCSRYTYGVQYSSDVIFGVPEDLTHIDR